MTEKALLALLRQYRRKRGAGAVDDKEINIHALERLRVLVLKMEEWQIDWSALRRTVNGRPNPDYDPTYLSIIRTEPERVFDSDVIEARHFLESIGVLPEMVTGCQ